MQAVALENLTPLQAATFDEHLTYISRTTTPVSHRLPGVLHRSSFGRSRILFNGASVFPLFPLQHHLHNPSAPVQVAGVIHPPHKSFTQPQANSTSKMVRLTPPSFPSHNLHKRSSNHPAARHLDLGAQRAPPPAHRPKHQARRGQARQSVGRAVRYVFRFLPTRLRARHSVFPSLLTSSAIGDDEYKPTARAITEQFGVLKKKAAGKSAGGAATAATKGSG